MLVGLRSVEIQAREGEAIGQIVGGQIGGRSIELSQSGCMCPLTHWQVQPAVAAVDEAVTTRAKKSGPRNLNITEPPVNVRQFPKIARKASFASTTSGTP